MRSLSIGAALASAALMSMSMAGASTAVSREVRAPDALSYGRQKKRPYRGWGKGRTKKLKAGQYKGSRWAKMATRLGGNPARF